MKLVVTDACIFIDLIEIQLTSEFFGLPIEVHTSLDVYNEINSDQKEILKAYRSVGKLLIHNITSEEKEAIQNLQLPKALSDSDKTVIFLADKLKASVISSDKAVRKSAKSKSINYHGMLWILDRLIENKLITAALAISKTEKLVSINIMYQNNVELSTEINKRKGLWKGLIG